ncbi:Speckle-type POZ protein-like B like protein [Argiope bruennichi]|uniref:Speckle-type POZ protein-like B like protein n=1 Tax=Argiope bruennichi TaxID=94029 RepID=A0A8T0EQF2_ARGBR|nr:Speckle-type POZ protein-like B like protein [Argiope bruennichi]
MRHYHQAVEAGLEDGTLPSSIEEDLENETLPLSVEAGLEDETLPPGSRSGSRRWDITNFDRRGSRNETLPLSVEAGFRSETLSPDVRNGSRRWTLPPDGRSGKTERGSLREFEVSIQDQFPGDRSTQGASKNVLGSPNVLCARSPVFRSMLTTKMKEKIMERIQIDDLDDDTIDQFLRFLYTDDLKDLQWESAMKLYYAADKYQVQLLKYLCSSFLVARLDISNVTDLLCSRQNHDSN